MTRPANSQPGSEKPVARHEPAAVVGWRNVDDLPQEEFDELVAHLKAVDAASMLPDDVPGIGTRRRP